MAKIRRYRSTSGDIPSPSEGVPVTSPAGKGSRRSAYGKPLPGGENPGTGGAQATGWQVAPLRLAPKIGYDRSAAKRTRSVGRSCQTSEVPALVSAAVRPI